MKARKKTVYDSMDNGGRVRKPEEYRGQIKKADRKKAIAKAKRQALEESKGTGKRGTAYSATVGSESLREGQVKRRGRRLERVANKAGMTRDEAYTVGAAESKAVDQKDAGNQKASEKALKASKMLDKYRGQKKVTAKYRPEKKRTEPARGTKKKKTTTLSVNKGKATPRPRKQEKQKKGVKRITSYIPGGWRGQGG